MERTSLTGFKYVQEICEGCQFLQVTQIEYNRNFITLTTATIIQTVEYSCDLLNALAEAVSQTLENTANCLKPAKGRLINKHYAVLE